ncbi:helix-turn-helix domain-containing protein [Phocaeicola plebeius]|nr:helix-turn-helix domain-containing protein [Phocaeicola plebeius]
MTGSRMSVKEIASRMGYIDSCYLNKLFRQHHGMTPVEYRKRYISDNN